MKLGVVRSFILLLAAADVLALSAGGEARLRTRALYAFTGGADGGGPMARLAFDPAGNIFGTTHFGGIITCGGQVGGGCGVVFELTRRGHTRWTETPVYAFADGADGAFPNAGVILDGNGNVYGTASAGGNFACSIGCGVVYELSKQSSHAWREDVLHAFTGSDGQYPNAVLSAGIGGGLYSTTWYGGAHGAGTVFALNRHGRRWTEDVLYSFAGTTDGSNPAGGVVQDSSGNLFGTTYPYNGYNDGVAYELRPHGRRHWKEQVLEAFTSGSGGEDPYAGLIMDARGNLFGTTIEGGTLGGGVVFELERRTAHHYREIVLHAFGGPKDGAMPYAGLTMDALGNLYGATLFGGKHGAGTVFELVRSAHGRLHKERILHEFKGGRDGANPQAEPIIGPDGDLYGTTEGGGTYGKGVVYEIETS